MIRVLIVEDDPTTGALLVQLVKRLRSEVSVVLESDALVALDAWQRVGADLVLLDWGLPGMLGIDLLKQIRRSQREALCVMITGNSERDAILEARAAKVDAYIVKPFDARQVMAKLTQLLGSAGARAEAETEAGTFSDFVERRLREGAIGLPVAPEFVDAITRLDGMDGHERAKLLRQCQVDPVVLLRVLSLANSSRYIRGSGIIETFEAGVRAIGLQALKNLVIELSLHPGFHLEAESLTAKRLELQQRAASVVRVLAKLRQRLDFDAAACRNAILLWQVGDLALMALMQAWIDQGGLVEDLDWDSVRSQHGPKVSEQIASQWVLPLPIRERISALDTLPVGVSKQESVILRLASLSSAGSQNDEVRRLLSRFGLGLTDVAADGTADAASPVADQNPEADTGMDAVRD